MVELEPITITANSAPTGKRFDHWEISNQSAESSLADRTASTTTYGNYYGDVTITAVYSDIIRYLDLDGTTTLVTNIKNELATRDSQITALQNENAELLDQIPTGEATGELINIQDSSNLATKEKDLLGNATQVTTSIAGGDEYDSPSPDHPQAIHVVTGDVTYKQCEKNVKNINGIYSTSSTSNLQRSYENGIATLIWASGFSLYMTENGSTNQPISLPNSSATYTISFKHKGDALNLRFDESSTDIITTSTDSGYVTYSHTFTNLSKILLKFVRSANTGTAYLKDFQLEVGSTTSQFEPYTSQSITLPLGNIELAKIGDYADKLFHAVAGNTIYESLDSTTKASLTVGKWYKQGNINKLTLNGNENWVKTGNDFAIDILDYLYVAEITTICNYYQAITNGSRDSVGNNQICFRYHSNLDRKLYIRNDNIATASDFQTWLSTHNTIVYYVLATPTYTEITDTSLITALEQWRTKPTYRNITNSWTEPSGTNATPSMVVVYRKDLATVIDNLQDQIDVIST